MPSCDQIGFIHFHSSTTPGSASFRNLRILPRVAPRQSPSSAILCEMSSDADWPWLTPDFFMFPSCDQTLADVAGRRRQEKYESPQSTPVAAAQLHASG